MSSPDHRSRTYWPRGALRARPGHRARLARRAHPGPAADGLGVGRPLPGALATGIVRARALAHRTNAVPAEIMDCLSPSSPVPAGRAHEGLAGRRDGVRQQLDCICDSPGAGADDGGGADGGAGQAQLQAAARPADRGKRGPARAGQGAPQPGQRQYGALEGVPGRRADHDRRQQRGRPALDAGALSVPGRSRRLPGRRRGRGRPDPARRAALGHVPAA